MSNPVFIAQLSGGFSSWNYVAKTANYTAGATDRTIDCTANSFTVTLPTASSLPGREYVIKNSGTGLITIDTTSSQTIDGLLTVSIVSGESIYIQSNGTNWIIL